MKHLATIAGAVTWALAVAATAAYAQIIPPGGSQFNPPMPPPPASPKIEVPAIPQMDVPLPLPGVQPAQRGSFGDRIRQCLDEAAAAGLGPNERAAYSRACANR